MDFGYVCFCKRKDVSRSLSVHQSINSANYEYAINLSGNQP